MNEALANKYLVRFAVAYFTTATIEWAVASGSIVYAYQKGGARVAGLALIVTLLPHPLVSIPAGALTVRHRPNRVCLVALMLQFLALVGGALVGFSDGPVSLMVLCTATVYGSLVLFRPASAALSPSIVRSARELTLANIWLSYGDSASGLVGPLLATVFISLNGVGLVFLVAAGLAALAAISMVPLLRIESPKSAKLKRSARMGALRLVHDTITGISRRPGALGVLAVSGGQYVLLGGLDLMIVVVAEETLHLGSSGPSSLFALVGVGGLLGALSSSFFFRTRSIARILIASLLLITGCACLVGGFASIPTALILLPGIGLGRTLINLTTRMLLQRSVLPNAIGSVFATIELLSGVAMIMGAVFARIIIGRYGVETCFVLMGVYVGLLLAATWRALLVADANANVPVVAIGLLRTNPAFCHLSPLAIDAVARTATEMRVNAGDTVIAEGDIGDRFYVVSDGSFAIERGMQRLATVTRGGSFGEVALLADVPRTATITADTQGYLLAIDRDPFLHAMTGSGLAHQTVWGSVRAMNLPVALDDPYLGGPASSPPSV